MAAGLPHILLIVADQLRYDCLGANGHPLTRTPSLDRLAAAGVRFTHAFCPIPLCVPSRASLLCGQWPGEHLSIANFDTEAPRPLREDVTTYVDVLRGAGYRLGHVGKWGVHPVKGPCAFGFDAAVPESDYAAWRAAQGLPPRPACDWRGGVDVAARPEQSRLAWGADRLLELLEAWSGDAQPWFLTWQPSEPHLPNVPPEPYASRIAPAEAPPWPSFPDPLAGKPYIQRQQRRTWQVEGWSWEQWAPIVARYLGEVELLDAQLGKILDVLEARGLADNTVVIVTADHGDLCGGHGMVDKHYVMYDDVTRVPLFVRWPAGAAAGADCDAFVSHSVDLAATFCALAGAPIPDGFRGLALTDLLADPRAAWPREDIFACYHGNQFGLYSQRMVRDRRWKYVWNAVAEDELYDLATDPGEIHNAAGDPAHAATLSRLRTRLVAWMEETRDPLLNGWTRRQLLEGLIH